MPTPSDYLNETLTSKAFIELAMECGFYVAEMSKPDGLGAKSPGVPSFLLHGNGRVLVAFIESTDKNRGESRPLSAGHRGWADALEAKGCEVVRVCSSNVLGALRALRGDQ